MTPMESRVHLAKSRDAHTGRRASGLALACAVGVPLLLCGTALHARKATGSGAQAGPGPVRPAAPTSYPPRCGPPNFPGPRFEVGSNPVAAVVADLDGDAVGDLVVADASEEALLVMPGNGAGGFGYPVGVGVGETPALVGVIDLDADGDMDLISAGKGQHNKVFVALNHGHGEFAASKYYDTCWTWRRSPSRTPIWTGTMMSSSPALTGSRRCATKATASSEHRSTTTCRRSPGRSRRCLQAISTPTGTWIW